MVECGWPGAATEENPEAHVNMKQASYMPSGYVKVASVNSPAPGEMIRVEVGAECICLAGVDETFYAMSDGCSHTSASLSEGELKGHVVTCPVHADQFDIRTAKPFAALHARM